MGDFKLKLRSKKLQSGRYQINFSTEGIPDGYYGYLLMEPHTAVTEVIEKINRHIQAMTNRERYLQRNLYSLVHRKNNSGRILIFKKALTEIPPLGREGGVRHKTNKLWQA
ncbi:MAG: hypothetical protein JST48_13450 [Bacteroidetes bacterium]|nr:hypothetical protein [Bacteroidota bacterium]